MNLPVFLNYLLADRTTMSILATIVVIIVALIINRKRDASGRITFVDRGKTGVIAVRVFEIVEGFRKRSWILPLWSPENNLRCRVSIQLPVGQYELKACWLENQTIHSNATSIFEAQPYEEQKAFSLSDVVKFRLAKPLGMDFTIQASGKTIEIDSPEKKYLKYEPDNTVLPLALSNLSITNRKFIAEKINNNKFWEFYLIDERMVKSLKRTIGLLRRKLDGLTVKNRELESNIDQTVDRLRKNARSQKRKPTSKPA